MTVSQKLYKKKVVSLTVPLINRIIQKEKELYIEFFYSEKNIIDINYIYLEIPNQEWAKII